MPDVKEINEAKKRARHSKADGGNKSVRKKEIARDWDLAALSKFSSSFVESYCLMVNVCA